MLVRSCFLITLIKCSKVTRVQGHSLLLGVGPTYLPPLVGIELSQTLIWTAKTIELLFMIFYFHFIICRSVIKEGHCFIISSNHQFRVFANKVIFFPFLAKSNQMWGREGHWLGNTSSGLQSLLAVNQYDHLSTKYWDSGKYWEYWEILLMDYNHYRWSVNMIISYQKGKNSVIFFQC